MGVSAPTEDYRPVAGVLQQDDSESPPFAEDEVETPAKSMLRVRASRWQTSNGVGVIMTITDETRLHRLENMRREFTTNVSHELKTPLAAIKAYTETLLLGALRIPSIVDALWNGSPEQSNRTREFDL